MKPTSNANIVGKLPLASEKQLCVSIAETEPPDFKIIWYLWFLQLVWYL